MLRLTKNLRCFKSVLKSAAQQAAAAAQHNRQQQQQQQQHKPQSTSTTPVMRNSSVSFKQAPIRNSSSSNNTASAASTVPTATTNKKTQSSNAFPSQQQQQHNQPHNQQQQQQQQNQQQRQSTIGGASRYRRALATLRQRLPAAELQRFREMSHADFSMRLLTINKHKSTTPSTRTLAGSGAAGSRGGSGGGASHEVECLLVEAVDSRVKDMTTKEYREMTLLAYAQSLPELVLALFDARSKSSVNDPGFCIYDTHVNSAFQLKDVQMLTHLSNVATAKLLKHPWEIYGDLANVQVLWLLFCLLDKSSRASASSSSGRGNNKNEAAAAAAAATGGKREIERAIQAVWANILKVVDHSPHSTSSSSSSSSSSTLLAPSALIRSGNNNDNTNNNRKELLARLHRNVMYNRGTDMGEMTFYYDAFTHGMFRCAHAALESPNPILFTSLIRSCKNGRWCDRALEYYTLLTSTAAAAAAGGGLGGAVLVKGVGGADDDFRGSGSTGRVIQGTRNDKSSATTATAARRSLLTSTDQHNNGSFNPTTTTAASTAYQVEEFVLLALLQVFLAARDHTKIIDITRGMLGTPQAPSPLSHSVLTVVATASGELQDAATALAVYNSYMLEVDTSESSAPSEYSLFVCMSALGKCGISHYPRMLDEVFVSRRLLRPTTTTTVGTAVEQRCYLLLQWANNRCGVNHEEIVDGVLRDLREGGIKDSHTSTDDQNDDQNPANVESQEAKAKNGAIQLSERIVNQILHVYQRTESSKLLPFYRHVVDELNLFRAPWLAQLVLWADRRRYALSSDERTYILGQLKAHGMHRMEDSAAVEGLRSSISLLQFDADVDPCGVFKASGKITEEPQRMDSRLQFLRKGWRVVDPGPLFSPSSGRRHGDNDDVSGGRIPVVGIQMDGFDGLRSECEEDGVLWYIMRKLRDMQQTPKLFLDEQLV